MVTLKKRERENMSLFHTLATCCDGCSHICSVAEVGGLLHFFKKILACMPKRNELSKVASNGEFKIIFLSVSAPTEWFRCYN